MPRRTLLSIPGGLSRGRPQLDMWHTRDETLWSDISSSIGMEDKIVPPPVESTGGGTSLPIVVASPSELHEVKHPNVVGRVSWEWERNQG